jgi:hypothetical protein
MLGRPASSQLVMYCSGTQKPVKNLNLYGIHVMHGLETLMQKKILLLLVVLCFY